MTAAAIGQLAAGFVERADPDRRGPDERVRRESLDEHHAGARPWDANRFTSPAARYATTESLVDLAKEMQREAHAKFPRPLVRELKERREALRNELAAIAGAPAGRPAALRNELAGIEALLDEQSNALTRTDVDVLEAMLSLLRRTGEWIASWGIIAERTGCERKGVGRALAKLCRHGFLAVVRRSRRVEANRGTFAPQREQIPNAYRLTLKGLVGRLRHRFEQLRSKRYARMTRAKEAPPGSTWQREVADPELRRVLAKVGTMIDSASP